MEGSVSEWLRSRTRNPMGSAREGSNPFAVDSIAIQVLLFEIQRKVFVVEKDSTFVKA